MELNSAINYTKHPEVVGSVGVRPCSCAGSRVFTMTSEFGGFSVRPRSFMEYRYASSHTLAYRSFTYLFSSSLCSHACNKASIQSTCRHLTVTLRQLSPFYTCGTWDGQKARKPCRLSLGIQLIPGSSHRGRTTAQRSYGTPTRRA